MPAVCYSGQVWLNEVERSHKSRQNLLGTTFDYVGQLTQYALCACDDRVLHSRVSNTRINEMRDDG